MRVHIKELICHVISVFLVTENYRENIVKTMTYWYYFIVLPFTWLYCSFYYCYWSL